MPDFIRTLCVVRMSVWLTVRHYMGFLLYLACFGYYFLSFLVKPMKSNSS